MKGLTDFERACLDSSNSGCAAVADHVAVNGLKCHNLDSKPLADKLVERGLATWCRCVPGFIHTRTTVTGRDVLRWDAMAKGLIPTIVT